MNCIQEFGRHEVTRKPGKARKHLVIFCDKDLGKAAASRNLVLLAVNNLFSSF